MTKKRRYYEVDFSNFDEITEYAYGESINIATPEDYKDLLLRIIEKAKKDNRYLFRKEHDCKYCLDYEKRKCNATCDCKYELNFEKGELLCKIPELE